jgi:hypothetical protein
MRGSFAKSAYQAYLMMRGLLNEGKRQANLPTTQTCCALAGSALPPAVPYNIFGPGTCQTTSLTSFMDCANTNGTGATAPEQCAPLLVPAELAFAVLGAESVFVSGRPWSKAAPALAGMSLSGRTCCRSQSSQEKLRTGSQSR